MTDRRWRAPTVIGTGTLSAALILVAWAWIGWDGTATLRAHALGTLPLVAASIMAIVAAYRFPIYIRHNTKICVFTVPVYFLTVFLAPPLAGAAAGLGIFLGELAVRSRHANDLSDIVTHTGRWTVIVWLASVITHLPMAGADPIHRGALFCAAGIVLWAGDIVTVPLALAPVTEESVHRIMVSCVRNGGLIEAVQYGVAIVGAIVVSWQPWALVLLVVPTILLYLFNRKEVDSETLQLLESMADAVDLRDPYTVGHSRRVAQVAAGILHTLGRTGQEAALVLTAARVHDIGKTVIPDHLLLKHGPLTGEERPTMERHATHGAELLEHYPDFARIVDMVRSHHERWDGGGYPDGLRATEIPYGARVIAVADAYVAMVSARSYRPALLPSQAAEILRNGRGRQWDPQIVDALLQTVADEPNLLDMPAGRPDESAPPDVAASAAVI